MINAADIVIGDLPSIVMGDWDSLPDAPGIYFALNANNDVLYIGKAKSLRGRWSSTHHRYKQIRTLGDGYLHWLELDDTAWIDIIEAECIDYFNPRLNRLIPNRTTGASVQMMFTISTDHRDMIREMQQIAMEKYGVSYTYAKLIEASISALHSIITETD